MSAGESSTPHGASGSSSSGPSRDRHSNNRSPHDASHSAESSSSSQTHPSNPHLPPTGPTGPPLMASELDPFAMYIRSKEMQPKPKTPEIPEKCWSFCMQRADDRPMCRMFCLRKKPPLPDQKAQLARYRAPKPTRLRAASESEDDSGKQVVGGSPFPTSFNPSFAYNPATVLPPLNKSQDTPSQPSQPPSSSGSSSGFFEGWTWNPFKALQRRVEPYTFIYVRGTLDGVVGRYMEEMEYDDGEHDFGTASRGGDSLLRRKGEQPVMEWMDWGSNGSLLFLPFTSIFFPILNLPTVCDQVFSPGLRLIEQYRRSWIDGTQKRNLGYFTDTARAGDGIKFVGLMGEYWGRRSKEAEAMVAERHRKIEEEREKVAAAKAAKAPPKAEDQLDRIKKMQGDKGGQGKDE